MTEEELILKYNFPLRVMTASGVVPVTLEGCLESLEGRHYNYPDRIKIINLSASIEITAFKLIRDHCEH